MERSFVKLVAAALGMAALLGGCAQKLQIKALAPAEVGAMAAKKRIAVNQFRSDSVGLSGAIEADIAKQQLDGQKYFTVLSRKDLDRVIAEQKLQSSSVMDETTAAKVGKLVGAQAIINGEVTIADAQDGFYLDERKECLKYAKDKDGNVECAQWHFYKVKCNTLRAAVSANVNIVDVQDGSVVYGDLLTKNYSGDSCLAGVLSKTQALNTLTSKIADDFTAKLVPHYFYFQVKLLDSLDVKDADDVQSKKFENALEYIKQNRLDKAGEILKELLDAFNGNSSVVAYDLGVVYEAQMQYEDAKKMYKLADDKAQEPNEEISAALVRIDQLIMKRDEAKKQMAEK